MDVETAFTRRRSCRDFDGVPVDASVLDRVLDAASYAPAAGNTWGIDLLALVGREQTAAYWDVTLPAGDRRTSFRWPGLLRAPVLVVPYVSSAAYVDRYAEADKTHSGLGEAADAWPVPYWWVDGGAAVMAVLMAAADAGLGALFFGQFAAEAAVADRFGVPTGWRALGTVALGHPAAGPTPSRSASRGRRPLSQAIHRGRW